jgi:T4-like virus Myoviridae tail sheath stabiliser
MFGDPFYHELLRKYVSIFGSLFNDIRIKRSDGTTDTQYFKIPISYGPREKYWAMVNQKPDSKVQAIILPRMSFEITGIEYDSVRKVQRTQKTVTSDGNVIFEPVPYNINFQLNVMAKSTVDALKIIEQILPYFNPDWTVTAQLIDGQDRLYDIPIVRTGQSHTDAYEADFVSRRILTWQFDFTMKAWLHGPNKPRKVIKFVRTNLYGSMEATQWNESITVQPGLTANGQPTSDINETIGYQLIEETDDYGYITQVVDYE